MTTMHLYFASWFTGTLFFNSNKTNRRKQKQHVWVFHQYDAGADEEPTCPPPQPETIGFFSNHHLDIFNKTVPAC